MTLQPTFPNKWLTLIVVSLGSFISFLDLAIINIVLPDINTYFKSGLDKSNLIISSYTLAMSIMLLCSGWFARRYGFKKIYIIGIVIFTTGSFLSSIAPSLNYLIVMRTIQGLGCGVITPLSMAIIAHNFTGKDRGVAIGILIMAISVTISIGPLIGGYLSEINEWRWVFRINIPIGVLLIVMALYLMREYRDSKNPKFDYVGVLLLLIWAPMSLYILSANFEWSLFSIFVVAFTLFILRMIYANNPLIDINIFKNREFVLSAIVMACMGIVLQGGNYITSEYLLLGLHYSAYETGILFIPVGIIQGILAPVTGYLTHRYGDRIFILLGLLITLGYLYLSSTLAIDTPYWYISLTLYIRGVGIGLAFTALTNLSLKGAKSTEIDSVSGVVNMTKQLSGSLSIAIITLIVVNKSTQITNISDQEYINATDSSFLLLFWIIVVALIAMLLIRKKSS